MADATKEIPSGKLTTVIALMTMLVTGSMLFIYAKGTQMVAEHEPLLAADELIRLEVVLVHLRFAELTFGDADVKIDAIWKHFDQAEWYAHAMLEGGQDDKNIYVPIDDPQLREEVNDVLIRLADLRRIVQQWLSRSDATASNRKAEQLFDMKYAVVMQETNDIERTLQLIIKQELATFQRTQIALIVLSLLLGLLVAVMFGRFVRRINGDVQILHDTHEELQRSNRDLASFAYIASHDLREPLRKIQAFGDRLLTKESEHLSTRGKDYIVRMQKAGTRMKDLIEALLNYSRIGTKGDAFTSTDLNKVMRTVLDDLEFRIKETGGIIHVSELPKIDADKTQIRQVFQNLIANALKFRREGIAPEIRVDATTENGMCTLTFSDNGIGFEAEYSERIFGVFQRLHGRDAYEGTGIGLSICQKTAERHGGSIGAEGRPGEGATFTLTLPVKQEETA